MLGDVHIRFFEAVVLIAEVAGALVILVTVVRAIVLAASGLVRSAGRVPPVLEIRFALGRGLVLGLEFLIAADIVRTILAPTLQEIGVLAAIIAVRTGLAFSIEYELRQARRSERLERTDGAND